MEKINFGYSMKNIPIPDEKSYVLQLIQEVEDFIKKMKQFKKSGLTVPFEENLIKLVKNLRFRKVDNKFQRTLALLKI